MQIYPRDHAEVHPQKKIEVLSFVKKKRKQQQRKKTTTTTKKNKNNGTL